MTERQKPRWKVQREKRYNRIMYSWFALTVVAAIMVIIMSFRTFSKNKDGNTVENTSASETASVVFTAETETESSVSVENAEAETETVAAPSVTSEVVTEAVTTSHEETLTVAETETAEASTENTTAAETTTDTTTETTTEEETTEDPRNSVFDHYTNLGFVVVENYLNIRATPSTSGQIIGIMNTGSGVDILDVSEDGMWYHIISNGIEGYIFYDYVATGDVAMQAAHDYAIPAITVDTETLNVRALPDENSTIVTQIHSGSLYYVTDDTDPDWLKIEVATGIEGYVSRDYVEYSYMLAGALPYVEIVAEPEETETETETVTETVPVETVPQTAPVQVPETTAAPETVPVVNTTSSLRLQIITTAMSYVGGRYVWGGTTLGVGVDCSGFIQQVFKLYGISLPRTSYEQVNVGTAISLDQLQPGDLLFYWNNNNGRVGHVAMYIGDGKIVHAASEARGIVIDNINYMTVYAARNVIG